MKIVIDLQAAQSASRLRGIGRYSLSLAKAIANYSGEHEIWLALNGSFPDTIESIYSSFKDLIPLENIKIFHTNQPSSEYFSKNIDNANISKKLRENFLHNLNPDIIHVSSLFEGLIDDAITSIESFNQFYLTSVTFYDLIPLIYSENYLQESNICKYYYKKLQDLKKADLLCAISSSAKQEAIDLLSIPSQKIINCSVGIDEHFIHKTINIEERKDITNLFGIRKKFILYVGDFDYRKNIQGLIKAFSLLDNPLRKQYQLVIIGNANKAICDHIFLLAKKFSLNEYELIVPGYVTDDQLLVLYNLCSVFILPSLHESIGLPLLEAIACGAAALASNIPSMAEIVSCKEALFDPKHPSQIAEKLSLALTNRSFRNFIIEHQKQHIKKFTWRRSAKIVLEAYEEIQIKDKKKFFIEKRYYTKKQKLAFISPLPPEKTGIADYSMQLITELICFYDITLIVDKISNEYNTWLTSNFTIQDCEWFKINSNSFDIILYQFGNSNYHYYMLELIEKYPGLVVLHDFFISDLLYYSNTNFKNNFYFLRSLFFSHGYSGLLYYLKEDIKKLLNTFPCNFSILKKATGIVVHSDHALDLAQKWYQLNNPIFIKKIPQIIIKTNYVNKVISRNKLNLSDNDFLICSFGFITPYKLIHRICFCLKNILNKFNIRLILVGENIVPGYELELLSIINKFKLNKKITITNFVSSELLAIYLSACNLAIQLRINSRGETSSCIINCLASSIPTIINAHASFNELPDNTVYKINENFSDQELENAVEYLYKNQEIRNKMSQTAYNYANKHHHPNIIAKKYYETINFFSGHNPNFLEKNLHKNLAENFYSQDEKSILATAVNIISNRVHIGLNQFFVDISTILQKDLKSGIQRVVRGILIALLNNPPAGFRIEPIYLNQHSQYVYARKFTLNLLNLKKDILEDHKVEVNSGDIFLGLDLCLDAISLGIPILKKWKLKGVKFYFIIYDFLPLCRPEFFPSFICESFLSWLKLISGISDKLICISKHITHEYLRLIQTNSLALTQVNVEYFYLGSDIDATLPSYQHVFDKKLLKDIFSRRTFLSVGTIEPRKGYWQLINAFTQLWLSNYDINLIIIGSQGWMVEKIIDKIINHKEFNKRLFWFKNASDEILKEIYTHSTALVMASEDEGFGLPLIEAARYNLNIIVRNIPVFKEIAGKHAFYFEGSDPKNLAQSLKNWLELYSKNLVPKTDGMRWLTWKESTEMLLDVILKKNWLITESSQQKTLHNLEEKIL